MSRRKLLASQFYGTWSLKAWELFRDNELDAYPHGPDGEGRLVLSSNGAVSAFFQRRDWATVDAGVKASADRFLAFAGTWRLESDLIFYGVVFASEPGWIGKTLTRRPRFDRKSLILETVDEVGKRGESVVNRMTWKKAD